MDFQNFNSLKKDHISKYFNYQIENLIYLLLSRYVYILFIHSWCMIWNDTKLLYKYKKKILSSIDQNLFLLCMYLFILNFQDVTLWGPVKSYYSCAVGHSVVDLLRVCCQYFANRVNWKKFKFSSQFFIFHISFIKIRQQIFLNNFLFGSSLVCKSGFLELVHSHFSSASCLHTVIIIFLLQIFQYFDFDKCR